MADETKVPQRVGRRYLYDAVCCSLTDVPEWQSTFPTAPGGTAQVYLGPRPRFGIVVTTKEKYLCPHDGTPIPMIEYRPNPADSTYPRHFFLEVACFADANVARELVDAHNAHDQVASKQLLRLADQHAVALDAHIEVIAGAIGLLFHWQFVAELINENSVVPRSDGDFAIDIVGPALRNMELPSLNASGQEQLAELLASQNFHDEETTARASVILDWLMRAWSEHDPISKFLALFIPLEMLLSGYDGPKHSGHAMKMSEAIRMLIRSKGGSQKSELLAYFNGIAERQRPSLNARFEELAERAHIVGWQADVSAFKRFNADRNALLHHGEQKVRLGVSVPDDEVRELEDIVERYVAWSLFGNPSVYSSRWRQVRRAKS